MVFSEFFEKLTQDRAAKDVLISGQKIRAKYKRGRGKRLLVLFHPAQPSDSTNRPYFAPFLSVDVPQLSIGDPTLEGRDDLSAGWYLGPSKGNVPNIINRLAVEFSQFIGGNERIYLGGSSGGFAALLYSVMDPHSVAIAACPQVDLDTYNNSAVRKFKSSCYPESASDISIKKMTGIDLIDSYSKNFDNSAVILVSPGDYGHLFRQIAPLLTAIDPTRWGQILLNVDYHGVPGHSGSVPPVSYLAWVRAAIASKTLQASEIMETHYTLAQSTAKSRAPSSRDVSGVSTSDLRMADFLRDYHLRMNLES